MRISDWSSDVCSSDLEGDHAHSFRPRQDRRPGVGLFLSPLYTFHGKFVRTASVDLGAFRFRARACARVCQLWVRSEEHTSELQSLMRISYAVFCLKKKKNKNERQERKTITNTKLTR